MATIGDMGFRGAVSMQATGPRLGAIGVEFATTVEELLTLAPRGLARGFDDAWLTFAQTVRAVAGTGGVAAVAEGTNVRYAAMAALGLARLDLDRQSAVLSGSSAALVAERAARMATESGEPGALALAAWARAETGHTHEPEIFRRLVTMLRSEAPLATVPVAWMATAAVAAAGFGSTDEVLELAIARLLRHQGREGIFPAAVPTDALPLWRRHVGSFADQVYPLQALARGAGHTGNDEWLRAANTTAHRICELQGTHGQWWWHYDFRDGTVVEPYPVYSVHQHAMAPMVLFDLLEAGGADHTHEIGLGVSWLETHPEVVEELVSQRWGLVWRKVARREPRKAARALQATTSRMKQGARVPGVDQLLPVQVVDYECRPYELGWLLYAWLPGTDHVS